MRRVERRGWLDGLVVGVLSRSSSGSITGGSGFAASYTTVAGSAFVMGLDVGHGRGCRAQ